MQEEARRGLGKAPHALQLAGQHKRHKPAMKFTMHMRNSQQAVLGLQHHNYVLDILHETRVIPFK